MGFVSLKIAQPLMAGFKFQEWVKSRLGRKNFSAVPKGLEFLLMTFNPAINGWAILSEADPTACRVMASRPEAGG